MLLYTDCTMELINQVVHILPAPLAFAAVALFGVLPVIIEILTLDRIRIEIVIDMQTVDIITCYDISNHSTYVVTIALQCRVEIELSFKLNEITGITDTLMLRSNKFSTLCAGTIRVYPCMEFHIAFQKNGVEGKKNLGKSVLF